MPLTLKLDDQGHVVVSDGKPVYVHDDGKEIPFDASGTLATIARLNGEAKGHRERAEKAEADLKVFEGIEPSAARKALETVGKLDAKALIDAGEVDKVRAEAKKAFDEQLQSVEAKYKPVVAERDQLSAKLISRTIAGAFSGSKFIADKLAVPTPMVQATFSNAFKVEGDSVVGYASDGSKIFSRERPGEVAGFDEALSMLVEASPFRDQILKGTGANGGGATGSRSGVGGKTVNRQVFDTMEPIAQASFVKSGGTITD